VGNPSSTQPWIGAVIQTRKKALGSSGKLIGGTPRRSNTRAMVAGEALRMLSIIERNASRGSRPQKR
jgi:hypothetical protein